MKTAIYDVIPQNGQKSFSGKAKVIINDGTSYLKSYDTIHCSIDKDGVIHRYSDYKSHTTAKHLKSFLGEKQYKSYWSLPLEKKPEVVVVL